MSELMAIQAIDIVQGKVSFPGYHDLKAQAEMIAGKISEMEVTEENIKDVKKTLAKVNKSVKALNDERIRVKKELTAPYEAFAEQVKEIETIVKSADEMVRSQVREMEEQERQQKKETLRGVFERRIEHYEYAKIFTFDEWLEPGHLNKSLSLTKAEEQMVEWLEQRERDIKILHGMQDRDELLQVYRVCQDVSMTIEEVEQKKKALQEMKAVWDEAEQQVFMIKVFGKKDLMLAQVLLKENDIEFETIGG